MTAATSESLATRRRGATLEDAILAAVRSQLDEVGYAGLTFEGVAAAAGTGKGALYRRWSSKAELVVAATIAASDTALADPGDRGSARADLVALLRAVRDLLARQQRETMLSLLAQLGAPASESLHTLLYRRNSELILNVIARARARGEIGNASPSARILALPFDVARHDVFVVGAFTDNDIDSFVDECYVPLLRSVTFA